MKTLKYFFAGILFLNSTFCFASEKRTVLITAKATSVKFIRNNSDDVKIVAPMTLRVKLKNIKVIQGESSTFPSSIVVEMRANHEQELLDLEKIYLLLDITNSKPKVLFWESVVSMACIPKKLLDERYSHLYFEDKWGDSSIKCTFVREFEKPKK